MAIALPAYRHAAFDVGDRRKHESLGSLELALVERREHVIGEHYEPSSGALRPVADELDHIFLVPWGVSHQPPLHAVAHHLVTSVMPLTGLRRVRRICDQRLGAFVR